MQRYPALAAGRGGEAPRTPRGIPRAEMGQKAELPPERDQKGGAERVATTATAAGGRAEAEQKAEQKAKQTRQEKREEKRRAELKSSIRVVGIGGATAAGWI